MARAPLSDAAAARGGGRAGPADVLGSLDRGKTYHFVGIGGHGMSGLARVLLAGGFTVTGSDARASRRLEQLSRWGARVHVGHHASYVEGAGVVIYSTDVPDDNIELEAARKMGITLWHRSHLLAAVVNNNPSIAVAGTHGKTTITSMLGQVLLRAGADPTVIVGADVDYLKGNARLGAGPVVAEACESDGSFLNYKPLVAVVTGVEPEHLDHYGGSFDAVIEAFNAFARRVRPGGLLIVSDDDETARSLRPEPGVQVITYGGDPSSADYSFKDLSPAGMGSRLTVTEGGRALMDLTLKVPGAYNAMNALAAVAAARYLDLPLQAVASGLGDFKGAHRRFQVVGSGGETGGITIVDDYAHHPTEIKATLRASRHRTAGRLIAVFQPQRYARTHALMDDFSASFGDADEIVLAEIYSPPGDPPMAGVSSRELARRIGTRHAAPVRVIDSFDAIEDYLAGTARRGDMVITLGAGSIWRVAHGLARRLAGAGTGRGAGTA